MTQPSPPRSPADRQFARDVARQIDRRRMRRRLTLWTALLLIVAAAALYLRFGGGAGLGLGGGGDGHGEAQRPVAAPARCAIRVSPDGLALGDRAASRAEAVAACRGAPGVDIRPTGDARHGEVESLRAALEAAGARDVVVHPPPKATRPER